MALLKLLFVLFAFLNVTFEQTTAVPLLDKGYEIKFFAKTSWFNAHLSCLACGGQLATIESEAEQKHVEGLIRDLGLQSENFWLAGTDLANEGIFNWFTTGNLITYSNFAPGQPDNLDTSNNPEHCLLLWGEKQNQLRWNDVDCDKLNYFICENKPKCELKTNGEMI